MYFLSDILVLSIGSSSQYCKICEVTNCTLRILEPHCYLFACTCWVRYWCIGTEESRHGARCLLVHQGVAIVTPRTDLRGRNAHLSPHLSVLRHDLHLLQHLLWIVDRLIQSQQPTRSQVGLERLCIVAYKAIRLPYRIWEFVKRLL